MRFLRSPVLASVFVAACINSPIDPGSGGAGTGGDQSGGDAANIPGDTSACGACALGELGCDGPDVIECTDQAGCSAWTVISTCSGFEICLDATCLPGTCSTGDSVLCPDRGVCSGGRRYCTSGTWGNCTWSVGPQPESCDGLDNDCNGAIDDGVEVAPCPEQNGVCSGATADCRGAAGVDCDYAVYTDHAAAQGYTFEAGVELSCDGDDNDCDGSVDEMRGDDPNNCGTCGRVCQGGLSCISSSCGCATTGDCGANETCNTTAGTCECDAVSHSCGGVCSANNDPATCGSSCTACPAPANGAATCDGTSCGTSCNAGFDACLGQCVDQSGCSLCVPCAATGLVATAGDALVVLDWADRSTASLNPLPESAHPYTNNLDETRSYTLPGATSLTVTFDSATSVEPSWENVYVLDGAGTGIAGSPFTGTELAGVTVTVPGDTVQVRLTAGSFVTDWGYRVTHVVDENGSGAVASYRLYWDSGTGIVTINDPFIAVAAPPYSHTGRTNGTTYKYELTAMGTVGESPLSAQASATPAVGSLAYTVGGVVTGLFGNGLVLRLNGSETITINTDGTFSFVGGVLPGIGYAVTVSVAPTGPSQVCAVIDGSGTMPVADVTDVEIICSLQIATFNLENFDLSASVTKMQGIADIITDNDIDLIGVQEVSSGGDLSTWISLYLNTVEWGYRMGSSGNTQRVGFVYRRKAITVVDSGTLNSTRSGGYVNASAYPWGGWMRDPYWARLAVPGSNTAFDFVVLHLKALGDSASCDQRRDQVDDLAAWIINAAPPDLILVGDYNDRIAGNGNCSSVDTLQPLENITGVVFATEQPSNMASGLATYPSRGSVIDHILLDSASFGRLLDVDGSGHEAAVVSHGNYTISDHQPPFVWLGLE